MFDLVSQNFHHNIHTGLQYDYFFLNQKNLESKTILPKIFCNMHIARCNMHIAIESILPLTYRPQTKRMICHCIGAIWWYILCYDCTKVGDLACADINFLPRR